MAMPRKKHMDTSISADESEIFEAPSDIDASPRIKASTESPIPAESKRNPRPASYKKGKLGKDLEDALDTEFDEIRVEDVVIQRKDCRSRGYAFVILSWAQASKVDPSDICTFYSGM